MNDDNVSLLVNRRISAALGSTDSLQTLRDEFNEHMGKIGKFFDMFLEKFSSKLTDDDRKTPLWKLYDKKFFEYESYARGVRTIDYHIAKEALQKP